MDDELANMIIERYMDVLDETMHMVSGIPESRLPCDQSMVREAIKYTLSRTSKLDERFYDLQLAYERLGLFITDEEAQIMEKGEAALMSESPDAEGIKCLAKSAAIQEKIQSNMNELNTDMGQFIKTIPDIIE